MKSPLSIILTTFLRITVFPILIYSLITFTIINLVDPIPYHQGCFANFPEESNDFLAGFYFLIYYLFTTPIVLLCIFNAIFKRKYLRSIILLSLTFYPAFFFLFSLQNIYSYGLSRISMYIGLSSLCFVLLIIWNFRNSSKK